MALSPRDHIAEIRKTKFSIGGEPNPLTEDLHQAVKNLSAELYAKDVHFLMELIQNAEDNEYEEGVDPSLEFVITSKDITGSGAPATLLIFNNERGFSPKNIDSICSVGRSTKKGNRKRGYIGEKGIGFKSVFLITAQPYIFSNGYQIRFNEEPCQHCNVGYIVPEWVEENPTLLEVERIYGFGANLPTTTIVLPLKLDKVKPVKQQLSSIHPEVLLFLSKIKRLSVREDNEDPSCSTVSAISISSETNFITRKNIDAESFMLHLAADENSGDSGKECSYHMWRQRFPVRQEDKVEKRMEVDEWVITLAFPNGERLHRGKSCPGIYAFLPTEMITNLPFIIQADFLLASSRETILLDDKWNQGILNCVPSAFINAFTSLVKATEGAPLSSLPRMFNFLPVNESPYSNLNAMRQSIKARMMGESIMPCESYTEQKLFQKPHEVGRLMPAFWNLLYKARCEGVSFHNISSHGRYIISSAFDKQEYNHILSFLGVEHVDDEWYVKCIRSSNLILGVPDDVYLEILLFLAERWKSSFCNTNMKHIPLLKYVDVNGEVSLCRIYEVSRGSMNLLLSSNTCHISWLMDWNKEFQCAGNQYFVPKPTQAAIQSHHKRQIILEWLVDSVQVCSVDVNGYALLLSGSLGNDRKIVLAYVHFLYQSRKKSYLSNSEVDSLCCKMPLVDNYGRVTSARKGVIVPANGSRWLQLMALNLWRNEGYVELGEDYLHPGHYAGVLTSGEELVGFLKFHLAASDIPDLPPPDAAIPSLSSLLTKKNAFFLLDWIRNLNRKGMIMPSRFLTSIKEGSWLRISLNGSSGCRPPSQSFLPGSSWGNLLQNGSVLVDIPLVDQEFYGDEVNGYKNELRRVGVMSDFGEACQYIGNHLMALAASSTLTRGNVLSVLNFIRFLRDKFLPPDDFIRCIRGERWLRTSQGFRSPVGSVFNDEDWKAASQISDIPFIDQNYYGQEIVSFKNELELLGVVFGFKESHQIVVNNLKSPACLTFSTPESILLALDCMRKLRSSDKLFRILRDKKCMKTNMGYKFPDECFLFDPTWGSFLQVFNSLPIIDETFYGGGISSFKNELEKLGVIVDFHEATEEFVSMFKNQASSYSIRKENVLALLACYRKLKDTDFKFPSDLKKCIQKTRWLRTRLGDFRAPNECILFNPDWESISSVSLLPFIDDGNSYYGKGIHEYKEELRSLGVVVIFRNGAKFVASGLRLPQDPSSITPATTYSLLECIKILQQQQDEASVASLSAKASSKWMRTHAGHRSPNKCLLFDSDWDLLLRREDGPFIDEKFYGSNIISYKKELNALGVVVEIRNGCLLLACYINSHSTFTSITRIYNYLYQFNWAPTNEDTKKIWIPRGSDDGEWVDPQECVLHDKNGLFGLKLNVLEKHYEKKMLNFFSVLGVRSNPSLDDYCELWKAWEDSGCQLSDADIIAFWSFVMKNWNSRTEKVLLEELAKLPARSGPDDILLVDKHDLFIADDLYLKDLFQQSSSRPLFVWYPQPSSESLPREKLLEIYSKIGVKNLSDSVQRRGLSAIDDDGLKKVNPKEIFFHTGLFRLILGFLARPSLQMEGEKRHEVLRKLLNVSILEMLEPITLEYSLLLSSGEDIVVSASRMIRWEKDISKLFVQKLNESDGPKSVLEYATYFSEEVSEGLLWEKDDHVGHLAELIRVGFIIKFDEAAIGFLMKTENLEIYLEDEEFLLSSFPSD